MSDVKNYDFHCVSFLQIFYRLNICALKGITIQNRCDSSMLTKLVDLQHHNHIEAQALDNISEHHSSTTHINMANG